MPLQLSISTTNSSILMHKNGLIIFRMLEMTWLKIRKRHPKNHGQKIFNGRFYKYSYELASEFYINLQKHEKHVAKFPMNKSEIVKCISGYILLNHTKFAITDANNHPEGAVFLELHASSKISVKSNIIYILSQQDLLSHFYQFLASNRLENMKTTPINKLRLVRILLSYQVCKYLPDIMGISTGENWQQLDASRGCQAGWNLACDLFLDLNHIGNLPEWWCHPDTRNEINQKIGDDGWCFC